LAAPGFGRVMDEIGGMERLLGGDASVWNRFVERYAPVIFAAVRRRLIQAGRLGDVEDVVQDVFVRLCNHDFRVLRNYDPARARITTWLTVVANSASIDHLRRLRAPTTSLDDAPESALAVQPKFVETVKIPPELLSPRQALVLEMLYQREMEVSEVAKTLSVDPQTVRSTHHKALTKLRAHFREDVDAAG